MTSGESKPYKGMILWGWVLTIYSVSYGLIQFANTYASSSDIFSSWEACMERLGYPNNQPTSNCGTYQGSLDYMWGQVTEWLLTITFFLAISLSMLAVGYRRKKKAFQ
jgi:hypothetical protein